MSELNETGAVRRLWRLAADMRDLEEMARDSAVFTDDDRRLRALSHIASHAETFKRRLRDLAVELEEVGDG